MRCFIYLSDANYTRHYVDRMLILSLGCREINSIKASSASLEVFAKLMSTLLFAAP